MKDLIWYIFCGILFLLIGIVLIKLGLLIWKKQKIQLIHEYHYEKVSEENKPIFCKLFGIGVLTIGAGIAFSGISVFFIDSLLSFIPMGIGLIVGISLIIWTVIKYNAWWFNYLLNFYRIYLTLFYKIKSIFEYRYLYTIFMVLRIYSKIIKRGSIYE